MSKAIVLLSGGLDSATTLGIAKEEGHEIQALSFDYGQRHRVELDSSASLCEHYGVENSVIHIQYGAKGSALTDYKMDVPKGRDESQMQEIPVTYVPARNVIFLSFALGRAEIFGAEKIYCGVNAIDYSGYPDCRPEFIAAFQKMANVAVAKTVGGECTINVETPLISLTKAQIIKLGTSIGVPYHLTHSCYDPISNRLACGQCDSCILRKKGFEEAGVTDPTVYSRFD